jgi:hypothetical protein
MRRLPLIALALAALLAGCGGDDGGDQLSTADYRAEAKQICTDADKQTDAVEEPTRATNAAIVDYFEKLLEANQRATQRFEDLDPPEELQKAHDDALAANKAGAAEVEKLIGELEGGGDARQVLQGAQSRLQDLGQRADAAAERLGVPECSG